jgi:hypothetical protein
MTTGPGGYGYSPHGGPPPSGPSSSEAADRVSLPATLMIVLASLTILFGLVTTVLNLVGAGLGALTSSGSEGLFRQVFSGALALVGAVFSLIFNGVVLYGALKMRQLENHLLSVIAAVLFALPCSLCCVVNLPVGVWALIVLLDPNVKAAFRS